MTLARASDSHALATMRPEREEDKHEEVEQQKLKEEERGTVARIDVDEQGGKRRVNWNCCKRSNDKMMRSNKGSRHVKQSKGKHVCFEYCAVFNDTS